MNDKFLLYIDILGFSDLVSSHGPVDDLYKIIDELNVHDHDVFTTIVFSDTILVYNKKPPVNEEAAEYIVWYATEFAEDLHFRLIGKGIYFRAYLTYGEFIHRKLKNTESFYGQALIDAYNKEKQIQSTGLFIDSSCLGFLQFFHTLSYSADLEYVYLERTFKNMESMMFGDRNLPIEPDLFGDGESVPYLIQAVSFLRDIHENMHNHPSPKVRVKYLTTWDLYHQRYPDILDYLLKNKFSYKALCPTYNWSNFNS